MSILYIDDDAEDREFFKDAVIAIAPSFVCHTAIDGTHGLKNLEEFATLPDFIFLDVNMPKMTGREFLLEVKKIPRLSTIPVVMYSTTAHSIEQKEYLKLGAHRVIVKANSFEKVRELVASIIKK
jgi:CheY-like chemotaxis protein